MIDKRIERAIEALKRETLALGALVEEGLYRSFKAYDQRSAALADEVISGDEHIDRKEVEIEEECLKALALYQPTGAELRLTVALMKMADGLERMGGCAVNIAWQAHSLSFLKPVAAPDTMGEMAQKAKGLFRRSIEALINRDLGSAWSVLSSDDEIDALNRAHLTWVQSRIKESPSDTEALLLHLFVSRNLERLADLVINLAEDVIYMVDGEIVRQGRARPKAKDILS